MEEVAFSLSDYLAVFRRYRRKIIGVTVGLLLATSLLALLLPSVYQSHATILIEQQEIPQELVRSTVTTYADQRVQVISQRVMTTTNLMNIIKKYDLYKEEREKDPLEVVLDKMRKKDIDMEMVSADVVDPRSGHPTRATIAFTLSYRSKSPDLAQKVANELVTLYLDENVKVRTESASKASSFLSDESERLRKLVTDLEAKLAEFKKQNYDKLPEMMQANTEIKNRTELEIVGVTHQIEGLQQRKILLRGQLAQLRPNTTLVSDTGERILSARDRLRVLETEYASARSRYSDNHPDVLRLSKEIAGLRQKTGGGGSPRRQLEAQLGKARTELQTATKKYSAEHPDVKRRTREVARLEKETRRAPIDSAVDMTAALDADNPAYIELKAQVESVDADIAAAQQQQRELKQKLGQHELRLAQTPQVEQTYRSLLRNYESTQQKLLEIAHKEMEAKMSENLETSHRGERLTLIEPPLLPEKAASPNRLAIAALGTMLSAAGGVGTAAAAVNMDDKLYGPREVMRIVRVPPLAEIPVISGVGANKTRTKRAFWRYFWLAMAVLVGAALIVFHFFYLPLDELWYRLLNRL